jgi:nucleoside-diphosphate-sugar epimerase
MILMRVFVTGVDGYPGAVLAPYLLERDLEAIGLDADGWLFSDDTGMRAQPYTINRDLRDITRAALEGCDALAELSHDPLGENGPRVTCQINHLGSVKLACGAREAGIHPFVYPSSRSVYGAGSGDSRRCRVNFERVNRGLPGFGCRYAARDGARYLREVFEGLRMSADSCQFRAFTRLKQLRDLRETGQIGAVCRWR